MWWEMKPPLWTREVNKGKELACLAPEHRMKASAKAEPRASVRAFLQHQPILQ